MSVSVPVLGSEIDGVRDGVRLSRREPRDGQRPGDGARVEVVAIDGETERVGDGVRLNRREPGVGQRASDGVGVEHGPPIIAAKRGDGTGEAG